MQGNTSRDGTARSLRFGSLKWATQGLSSAESSSIQAAAKELTVANIASVLVDTPDDGPSTSGSTNSSSDSLIR